MPRSQKQKPVRTSEHKVLRVIVYTRVSTADEAQAVSCQTQAQRCAEYCKFRTETTDTKHEVVKVVSDEGVSARTMDRPGWREVERMLLSDEADLVLSTALDRLSRTVEGFLKFVSGVLEPRQKAFATLHDSVDTSTAMGRMAFTVLLTLAQFQREQTAERVSAARRSRAKEGYHTTYPPFGTKAGTVKGVPEKDPERWPYLVQIFKMAAAGEGDIAICRYLKQHGVRTVRGAYMDKTTVANLISNKFFIGKVRSGDDWFEAKHECRIEKELFTNAQRTRRARPGRKPAEYVYLLQDLLFTSHFKVTEPAKDLGKPLPLRPRWSKPGSRKYYHYLRADKMGRVSGLQSEPADELAGEFPTAIDAKGLDNRVLDYLISYTEGPLGAVLGSALSIAAQRLKSVEQELVAITATEKKVAAERKRTQDNISKLSSSDAATFRRSLKVFEDKLGALDEELDSLSLNKITLEDAVARLTNLSLEADAVTEQFSLLKRLRAAGDGEALRAAVRALVQSVDVRMDVIRLRLYSLPGTPTQVLSMGGEVAPTGIEPVPTP